MGHWHGEISSNVTFAYCTKGCIDVAVLRGRPLTHVDAKPQFIYSTFPFFFLHENSQRGCIKGKKVRFFNGKHTVNNGSVDCKETDSLGAQRLTSPACASLRLSVHYELFFHAPLWFFDTQSVLVHFLPKMGLWKSRYLKCRCARPQCVVLHTLVLMYS